ncbi:hypothetical protein CDL15_Pgr018871 [Punica granatum]|uniref:Uncharacterized protein n=1 Tax=Punica granatum TaxID=22663 RepID=A0A218VVK7_PUNGR|nr:hypothetical protein CDL15_Pgr018871 [Punica granatum]
MAAFHNDTIDRELSLSLIVTSADDINEMRRRAQRFMKLEKTRHKWKGKMDASDERKSAMTEEKMVERRNKRLFKRYTPLVISPLAALQKVQQDGPTPSLAERPFGNGSYCKLHKTMGQTT